jgi:2-phosphoglycerate kinase
MTSAPRVVLLVGGATGTGKSTVATEVAHRLGITRVTSTDFVRETMRAFFRPEVMPAIHVSSFEGDPLIETFLDQTRQVLVGVSALLARAEKEHYPLVLEGVHLVPGLLQPPPDPTVVQCVLAVHDADRHAANFFVREETSQGLRPMDKYLDALDHIRLVQDVIVEEANAHRVPVVDSGDVLAAVEVVLDLVWTTARSVERV